MAKPAKKLSFIFAAKTDIGLVRTENQDSFGKFPEENTSLYHEKGQLFIIADGMGGHKGGKQASSIAVKTVITEYSNSSLEESVAIKEAIEKANSSIYNQAGDSTEFGRMGTTCTVLLLKDEKVIVGHVGDSRIYKIENNAIEQITNDHTKVQEMLRAGILTPEEAINYPSKSVLARALGVDENVKVDINSDLTLREGQCFVLCTDGLAKVTKEEILPIVINNSPADACRMLVDLANERGGKDNVTVIIIKVNPDNQKKFTEPEPPKKEVRTGVRKRGIGWRSVGIVFVIILILLVIEFKNSIYTSFSGNKQESVPEENPDINNKSQPPQISSDSEEKLLTKAENSLKKKDYENALKQYEEILRIDPMHQGALKGVNEIASAYMTNANSLMDSKNFEEALKYYTKVREIQPDNEIVKNRISLCMNQISNKPVFTDSSGSENTHEGKNIGQITTTRFDLPGWSYPDAGKNEMSVKSYEIDFENTQSEKFILYGTDLFEASLVVSIASDVQNSTVGLIVGYSSPSDYYIFKHRHGGGYTLQKVSGNNVENLIVVKPDNSEKPGINLLKIQYSGNLISIYNDKGLLGSYKSIWGIFGKSGLYVDKNSSAKFQNVFLSGKTKLE